MSDIVLSSDAYSLNRSTLLRSDAKEVVHNEFRVKKKTLIRLAVQIKLRLTFRRWHWFSGVFFIYEFFFLLSTEFTINGWIFSPRNHHSNVHEVCIYTWVWVCMVKRPKIFCWVLPKPFKNNKNGKKTKTQKDYFIFFLHYIEQIFGFAIISLKKNK